MPYEISHPMIITSSKFNIARYGKRKKRPTLVHKRMKAFGRVMSLMECGAWHKKIDHRSVSKWNHVTCTKCLEKKHAASPVPAIDRVSDKALPMRLPIAK